MANRYTEIGRGFLFVLGGQPSQSRQLHRAEVGTGRLWSRDLHTEIRGDSVGGSASRRTKAHIKHVSCGHVFSRARHWFGRNNRRWPHSSVTTLMTSSNPRIAVVLLLVLGILTGCRQGSTAVSTTRSQVAAFEPAGRPSQPQTTAATWQIRYVQLQHKFEQGHYEAVIPDAEQAYKATTTSDRLWAWRFRVLQAKATLSRNDIKGALALLKMEQPSGLPIE